MSWEPFEDPPDLEGTDLAPEGAVWVCSACGKRSRTQFGFDADNKRTSISYGWDASCVLKATLCKERGK